ncbi:hypothetical protein KKF84_01840 [Myxococcota bacterium]|nr:hypothetical protein [Myxococcota bacterium]MBU1534027.1 hypothetical protein [Myxococcota bacterium]
MKHILLLFIIFFFFAPSTGCSAGASDGSIQSVNNSNNLYNNANNVNNINNANNNTNNTNTTNNSNNVTNFILGCQNIYDVLIDGTCTRTDYTCDLLNECDFGYACNDNAQCECIDPDICGAICNDSTNCPDGYQCDTNSLVCKEPLRCITDEMCDSGLCVQQELNTFICESTYEGLSNGESCESGLSNTCLSGVCYNNECVESCRSNSDCAGGTLCGQVLLTLGCIDETACAEPCDGPNQFCFRNICYDNACTDGSDCPDGGDCMLSLQNPQVGACGQGWDGEYDASITCTDDEFREPAYESGVLCIIPQACWNNEECPEGYNCFTGDDLLISNLGSTGFCGRLP